MISKKEQQSAEKTHPNKYGGGGDVTYVEDPTGMAINEPPPNVWIPVSEAESEIIHPVTGAIQRVKRQWHCQVHRDAFNYGAIPPNIDERVVVDLRWFASITPVFENRVTFNTEVVCPPPGMEQHLGDPNFDIHGMPQPTFHFRIPEVDHLQMHAMMSDMTYAANALGGFFPGSEPRFMPPGASFHYMGSVRIGRANDGKHVADVNSKVWLISNLYVAGNGVIPTAASCNPTVTSCALAYKSCNSIIAHFKSHKK